MMCCGCTRMTGTTCAGSRRRIPKSGVVCPASALFRRPLGPMVGDAGRLPDPPAAAVGEIGLDTTASDLDFREQERVFMDQLAVARDLRRPVTIHCRKAWGGCSRS